MISVVLAAYNGEKYIAAQIESIINQTYNEIEIICIDDCSQDSTSDIIQEYAKRYTPIIKFYKNITNLGIRKTFELGCQIAIGNFIAFSDQDDFWYPEKLELLHTFICQNNNTVIAYCNSALTDENLSIIKHQNWTNNSAIKGKNFYNIAYENSIMGCSMMVKKEFIDKVMPFPEDGFYHDWYLAIMAKALNKEIFFVDKVLQLYRSHSNNIVNNSVRKQSKSTYKYRTERRFKEIDNLNIELFEDQLLKNIMIVKKRFLYNILKKRIIDAYKALGDYEKLLETANATNSKIIRSEKRLLLRAYFI